MSNVLPDLIAPNLRILFTGTAVGSASARAGAYYAGPGNAFWPTLHAVGLTPRLLAPSEYRTLLDFGIGLTDVCKVASGSDQEVGAGSIRHPALPGADRGQSPADRRVQRQAVRGRRARSAGRLRAPARPVGGRRGVGPAVDLGRRARLLGHLDLAAARERCASRSRRTVAAALLAAALGVSGCAAGAGTTGSAATRGDRLADVGRRT